MHSTKEYFRNNSEITTNGITIDQGALWQLKNKMLILVDDDQHVETTFNSKLFSVCQN